MWAIKLVMFCQLSWMVTSLAEVNELAEVHYLTGEPAFRDVTLRWESDKHVPASQGFLIHYCELQAWGQHRCRTKTMDDSSGNEIATTSKRTRMYSMIVSGLRMSTNYSFEIRPTAGQGRSTDDEKSLPKAKTIIVATKGFSARATQCLPDASEVEVSTGPHFGGRITVEAADGERCAVDGNPDSPAEMYTLRINHTVCGSHVNETTVATFVIVQENLPILTHSTRRFLVLCTFQPETLTVRAGINLPGGSSRIGPENTNRLEYVHPEAYPLIDGVEQSESVNDVQVARLQRHSHMVEASTEVVKDNSVPQLVLMLILVAAGVVGLALAAWWFAPNVRRNKMTSQSSHQSDDASTISMYDNFDNSLRDSVSMSSLDLEQFACENDMASYTPSECSTATVQDDCSGVFTIQVRGAGEYPGLRMNSYSHSEA